MKLEERIIFSQENSDERENLIKEYMNFILSCAGHTLGKLVTQEDDACSVAIIAFDEAIRKYDDSKGSFLSFAKLLIKSRITDYLRKEYAQKKVLPFSSLSSENDNNEEKCFEIEDKNAGISDAAIEIACIREELQDYDISFFELPKFTPKSFKTKRNCQDVIRYIMNNSEMVAMIKSKKTIPSKQIMTALKVNEKLLERHRKYIIAAVVILDGDYDIISEYLSFAKKGVR